jgi:hypothetical protein
MAGGFMKGLILSLVLLTVSTFAYGQNYIDGAGSVKTKFAEYLNVKNSTSATTLVKGNIVCVDVTDDDGIGVDLCGTAGFKALCMIVEDSCAVGKMCRCQTKGYTDALLFKYVSTTNSVAGGVLYATTDGKGYAATAAAGLWPIGVALDVSGSADGVLEAYLDF